MLDTIKINLEKIYDQIEKSCSNCGRSSEEIKLMAATKTQSPEAILAAYEAGIRLFGENRVQEAIEKYGDINKDLELHFIGHLQSNKIKQAAPFFSCIQSIDKVETANKLDREAESNQKQIDVLLEVNTSGEESKFGFESDTALFTALEDISKLEHLRLRGLMTIGPFTNDQVKIRESFRHLKSLFDSIKESHGREFFDTLSMGMTQDYRIAIEEGSTIIRLGTAIFGPRA